MEKSKKLSNKKQCAIHSVVVNEAVLQYETCQKGKRIICRCKSDQECKEQSEVSFCNCMRQGFHSTPELGENKCRGCGRPILVA